MELSLPVEEGNIKRSTPELVCGFDEETVMGRRKGSGDSLIVLLGTVPPDKRIAGVYRVQAIYEYDGWRAVSDLVEVPL